jgi:NADPH2:quinone reductase
VGVYWGAALKADPKAGRAEVTELLSWFAAGKLKPCISATYPLEKAAEAIAQVAGRQTKGKTVVVME